MTIARPHPSTDLPQLIRTSRLTAGLTQEHLAALSELSVRTVRNLELGTGPLPRRGSLARIAAALGMNPIQRAELMLGAGYSDEADTAQDPFEFDANLDTGRLIRDNVANLSWISVQLRTRIGPHRVEQEEEEIRVMQARRDNVDGVYLICEADTGRYEDARGVGIECLEDCEVVETRLFREQNMRVIRLGFGRTLRRGESHSYRFRMAYPGDAPRRAGRITEGYGGNGFFRPTPLYAMRVEFDPADPPAECVQVYRSRPNRAVRDVRPIPLLNSTTAQLVIQDAKPGTHGLRWSWS